MLYGVNHFIYLKTNNSVWEAKDIEKFHQLDANKSYQLRRDGRCG